MRIRAAEPADVAELTLIAHAAKRHWEYPEAWIRKWSPSLTITERTLGAMHVFVAEESTSLLGFYALGGNGLTRALEHMWVRPEAMGRGVGRALMQHAVATIARAGAALLEIESDPNAVGFYTRLGALHVGAVAAAVDGAPDRMLPVLHLASNAAQVTPEWIGE